MTRSPKISFRSHRELLAACAEGQYCWNQELVGNFVFLFNNWIQWNNSTIQRQLRYWQPNLRTVPYCSLSAQRLSERAVKLTMGVCESNSYMWNKVWNKYGSRIYTSTFSLPSECVQRFQTVVPRSLMMWRCFALPRTCGLWAAGWFDIAIPAF
jgi:hypothetical protein